MNRIKAGKIEIGYRNIFIKEYFHYKRWQHLRSIVIDSYIASRTDPIQRLDGRVYYLDLRR